MTKFRSKLKRKTGTKKIVKGQSANTIPSVTKYRSQAKGKFFQNNLNSNNSNGLTMEAVQKHEARQAYAKMTSDPVKSISGSLKDFSIDDDAFTQRSMSQATTFATQFTACSNVSFNKLINNFKVDSAIQKEMLAILAALTEFIKEKGGNESNTEYFLALMETIEHATESSDIQAALMLLNMGIKSVPEAVLRAKFNETAETLLMLITRFMDSDEINIIKTILSCLSVVLRAQPYSSWESSSTLKFLDSILTFSIHSKPKIRKAAQHAVCSILYGSVFMLPTKKSSDEEDEDDNEMPLEFPKVVHPGASRVARFCIEQFKPEIISNNQTLLLYILMFLQSVLPAFRKEDIKTISENLLSIMTSGSIMIRSYCLQTFHALFESKTHNLTTQLVGKLISALYEYRPVRSDFRQVLAWLTVMKQAHLKLFHLDSNICIQSLPKFFEVCINDLWLSESIEVVSGASNAMKEILEECIKPICSDENAPPSENHKIAIKKVISTMTTVLSAPFGATSTHILVLIAVAFESMGNHFSEDLREALKILGMRYDDQSSQRVHIEHAVFAAISTIDIEIVLSCIPLTDASGNVSVKRSWILPLLREGLHNASLEYFGQNIMKYAYQCYMKWQDFKKKEKKSEAHIYELLCCQLWGLFPGFCRKPKDLHSFKTIARALGSVLNENPDLRPPVLDGFKELLSNLENEEDKEIFSKYAQNYMTRFFNIYTTKPATTYENEVRQSAFEVAKLYLAVTPKSVLDSLFENAIEQMNSKTPGSFIYDTLFDVVEAITLFQSHDKIEELFKSYIYNTLIKDKKEKKEENKKLKDQSLRRRLKKAYKLLQDILMSDNAGCIDFISANFENIEKVLTSTSYKVVEGTQVMRLSCFNSLMEKKESINVKDKILKISISEALASFNNEAVAKDGISYNVLRTVGKVYEDAGKLDNFVNEIMAGLVGDNQLISNTIIALKFIIQEFTENLSIETVKFVIDQILEFVVSNKRNEAGASLQFLVIFVKSFPPDFVANFLGIIMKSINLMLPDTRRHSRLLVKFLLKKLCKKFTPEEVIQLVPGNDEILHKKLRNIKKEINRAKRNRLESEKKKKSKDDEDSDDEELLNIQKKSMTMEDILADSESEMSCSEEEKENPKLKSKKARAGKEPETFIRESEDMIVDLADPNALSKSITSKIPTKQNPLNLKKKDENRGFKTASDGRLIIKDIEDDETDSDDDDLTGYKDKTKKKVHEEVSDDEENADGPSKKKFAYQAGGSGIHRPVAASVKSGWSNVSSYSKKTSASRTTGSEYKSKKAGGDMKKKGKMEPYAYVQLSRNSLNRRKRKLNGNQFKSISNKSKKKGKGK